MKYIYDSQTGNIYCSVIGDIAGEPKVLDVELPIGKILQRVDFNENGDAIPIFSGTSADEIQALQNELKKVSEKLDNTSLALTEIVMQTMMEE